METFDVIVIGAGQAGSPLAARLAETGMRTLLVERAHLGGTCVNVGCTPTKTMIASARAAHVARTAARLGVFAESVRVDWSAVVARKDRHVEQWRRSVARRLERAGDSLTVMSGHARFIGERQIRVNGSCFSGDRIVINAGARPMEPAIPGLDSIPWLDNGRVMQLKKLPDHLIVLGGGYIGCEFAQMFRRFGSGVSLVQRASRLLDREEAEVSEALQSVFRSEGIGLYLEVEAAALEPVIGGVRLRIANGPTIDGSHLLVAVGRRPNTDDLGCELGGIELDERGFIRVDSSYRTSTDRVYAVGDVTPGPQFTHASWDDHRILFDLLLGDGRRDRNDRLVPWTVFTDPQVAGVGITQREAQQTGQPYDIASMPFGHIARAIETDETAGLIRVLIEPSTDRILGARIVGAEAGELIHAFALLMRAGGTARDVVDAEMVHPTFAEGLQTAVMKLPRFTLNRPGTRAAAKVAG